MREEGRNAEEKDEDEEEEEVDFTQILTTPL